MRFVVSIPTPSCYCLLGYILRKQKRQRLCLENVSGPTVSKCGDLRAIGCRACGVPEDATEHRPVAPLLYEVCDGDGADSADRCPALLGHRLAQCPPAVHRLHRGRSLHARRALVGAQSDARGDRLLPVAVTDALVVSVTRTQEGRLLISLRYSYEGSVPAHRKRIEMAKATLREALDYLERSEVTDLGFVEDARRRVRTDRMEV